MVHHPRSWTELAKPNNEQGSFVGFIIKSVLFGMVVLQAFQYFRDYKSDSRSRKLMIVLVCVLETTHYVTSARMMYTSLASHPADSPRQHVILCIKVLTTVKILITLLVQSFYLHLIWTLSDNLCMSKYLTRTIRMLSAIALFATIGISGVFLAYMEQVSAVFSFSVPFLNVTSISVGSAAAIDCCIAIMMSLVLYKTGSRQPEQRSTTVINHLICFFVLSGLVNAVPKIMIIVLYSTNPTSILYLAAQFSVPSLCANTILALFNAKSRLRDRMDHISMDLKISSALLFGEPVLPEDVEAETQVPSEFSSETRSRPGPQLTHTNTTLSLKIA